MDGGAAKAFTTFNGDHVFYFDWSRDGTKMVCSRGTNISDAVVIALISSILGNL
ncbi:MAG TPA: hypothetical protein VKJ45_21015 [Blastocatellia bacterium]|nr:hypothetical protein [Blastocatellia bacterium]